MFCFWIFDELISDYYEFIEEDKMNIDLRISGNVSLKVILVVIVNLFLIGHGLLFQ